MLTPIGVNSFDPEGSGTPGENDGQLPLAVDGNPATGWSTESYNDRHFGNLKPGVGISLTLAQAERLRRLAVTSPTQGWSAEVFVSDADVLPASLSGWGSPVDSAATTSTATPPSICTAAPAATCWSGSPIWAAASPPVRAEIDELRLRS